MPLDSGSMGLSARFRSLTTMSRACVILSEAGVYYELSFTRIHKALPLVRTMHTVKEYAHYIARLQFYYPNDIQIFRAILKTLEKEVVETFI